jgi:hypothetical protein
MTQQKRESNDMATKAAKNVKRGDWIEIGRMAFQVSGDAEPSTGGRVWLPIGFGGSEFRADERVRMHEEA